MWKHKIHAFCLVLFLQYFPEIELHCFYFCIGKHLIVHHVCENASKVAENVHFNGFTMMNTV